MKRLLNAILPRFLLTYLKKMYHVSYGNQMYRKGLKMGRKQWDYSFDLSKIPAKEKNHLETYFDNNTEGPGIWKWRHYFDIYDRHFSRFRNKPVRILEIGIYSGGSLGMWQSYFGKDCIVYGMDIEDACKIYENDKVKVVIGDQSDRDFWQKFKAEVEPFDIILDDGGHLPNLQMVTLEEMLNHLTKGGVYLCEDITGRFNPFHGYVDGLVRNLHDNNYQGHLSKVGRHVIANPFQKIAKSVHQYPFVLVIETNEEPIDSFNSPKRGTQWQPFFD